MLCNNCKHKHNCIVSIFLEDPETLIEIGKVCAKRLNAFVPEDLELDYKVTKCENFQPLIPTELCQENNDFHACNF